MSSNETQAEPPEAPETVPNYLEDGVRRQDDDTLDDLVTWVDALLEHRRSQDVDVDEVVAEDEELVEAREDDGGRGTVVLKKIACGKDCGGCPHGPYAYRAYWRDGATRTEYLGRASDVDVSGVDTSDIEG